jgi:hypothetical protein
MWFSVCDLLSVSESMYRCFKYWRWQAFIKLLKLPHSFSFLPYVLRIETALTVAINLIIYACHIVQSVEVPETQCWDFDIFNANVSTFHEGWWQISMRRHDMTWLAVSFPHTPAIVQITVSSVQLSVCPLINLTAVVIHGMKLFWSFDEFSAVKIVFLQAVFHDFCSNFVCLLLVLLKFFKHSKLLLKLLTIFTAAYSFWTLWLQYIMMLLLPSRGTLFSFLNGGGYCSTYWIIPSLPFSVPGCNCL